MTDLTTARTAYLVCALWTASDEKGNPIDADYSVLTDFAPEALQKASVEVYDFINRAGHLLDGMDSTQVGHDLWLTRNHHGAGFWDRGLGEVGDALTEIAEAMGEACLIVGDDGLLYVE